MLSKIKIKRFSRLSETYSVSMRILKMVWQIDPWLFSISTFAIIIPAVIPFVNMYIYKLIIDMVVKIVSGGTFHQSDLYPLIALRIITYFVQDVAFRTQNLAESLLWTKVPIELNQMLLKKISSLDIHYFENDKFRNLLEKVRESYEFRPQRLITNIFYTIQSLVEVLIALVALIKLNWIFVLVISLVAIPEFINQAQLSKTSYGIWDAESPLKKRFHYLTHILQHQKEIKEIKMFALAKPFLDQLKKLQTAFYESNKKLAEKSYFSGLVFNGLSTVVLIGTEVFVIFQALAKKLSIGDIGFYTGVVTNFQNGLGGLLRNMNQVFENSLYVGTVFEILDSEPIIKIPDKAIKLSEKMTPKIEFKNVTFSYPDSDLKILKNFSLVIKPGEKIAFVGENGAGKSTIIKLLVRFYDVDEGEILISDINIKELDLDSLYKLIGVLFQDFNRYEDTATKNIHYGSVDTDLSLSDIIKASVSAGSDEMIRKYQKGYETMLGKMFEGGIELSGGQWQKIALARAFFRNAPILVLDEPTASIDAKAESEIFQRVEKLSKDKTVIIISHRFSTVRNADKIYVIDKGSIIEQGSHQELMKKDGQYASLFNLQAKGYQ